MRKKKSIKKEFEDKVDQILRVAYPYIAFHRGYTDKSLRCFPDPEQILDKDDIIVVTLLPHQYIPNGFEDAVTFPIGRKKDSGEAIIMKIFKEENKKNNRGKIWTRCGFLKGKDCLEEFVRESFEYRIGASNSETDYRYICITRRAFVSFIWECKRIELNEDINIQTGNEWRHYFYLDIFPGESGIFLGIDLLIKCMEFINTSSVSNASTRKLKIWVKKEEEKKEHLVREVQISSTETQIYMDHVELFKNIDLTETKMNLRFRIEVIA